MTTLADMGGASQGTRISTVGMSREEWLAIRKTGIGSSDAAVAAGLGYKDNTPIKLWEEKTGRREPDDLSDNEMVKLGNDLEDYVARRFTEKTGREVHRVNAILRDEQHPFMLANLDREAVGGDREVVECKIVGFLGAKSDEWGDDDDAVPERYLVQVQHQLYVRNRKRGFLAALFLGEGLRIYPIERNDQLISDLIAVESELWRCIQADEMPSVTHLADVKRLFPSSMPTKIEASTDIIVALGDYQVAKANEKEAKERAEAALGLIGGFMQENEALTIGGQSVFTYKVQSRAGYTVAPTSFRVPRIVKAKAS